eukprot:6339065-Heterocapsa_arctica.AAC.1
MESLTGATNAFVLKDLFSSLKEFCPVSSKNLRDTTVGLRYFQGLRDTISCIYSDSAGEIIQACGDLGILHDASRPGVPQSNAVIERTNLDILEGTRTSLIHAGLPECFWSFAAPLYCFNDNTDRIGINGFPLENGSPWFRAKGSESTALRLPLACAIIFHPSKTNVSGATAKWEGTGVAGVFAGYRVKP